MKCSLPITAGIALLAATVFPPFALAQRTAAPPAAPAARGAGVRGGLRSGFGHGRQPWGYPGTIFLPFGDYYPDFENQPPETEAPPPPGFFVAPPQPAAPTAPPAEPLVLEYQGGQWVRVGNYALSAAGAQPMKPGAEQAANPRSASAGANEAAEAPIVLPPALLVFRDGHKEEIGGYTIVGDTLYTSADYWTTGSWSRKVPIAELDLPATLKVNQERGGKFSLPSSPSEIVIRP